MGYALHMVVVLIAPPVGISLRLQRLEDFNCFLFGSGDTAPTLQVDDIGPLEGTAAQNGIVLFGERPGLDVVVHRPAFDRTVFIGTQVSEKKRADLL